MDATPINASLITATVTVPELLTPRLRLRAAHDRDVPDLITLGTDPRVRAHLGGPRPRAAVEAYFSEHGVAPLANAPGAYVIADRRTDRLLGTLTLDRRSPDRPGHVEPNGSELELSYVLHPDAWGAGLAEEAARALLRAAADELPDQPVLGVTQTANERSLRLAARLGFRPVGALEGFGAAQTLATAALRAFADHPEDGVPGPRPS
ncbi:GNAT family N-acetyltransferase [Streptomyces virginiae]|uniref:GNAT family N-acetyltransferase n=1 Tax=Streptomyces virginiae TaxID=1961 RepID=UPI003454AAA0